MISYIDGEGNIIFIQEDLDRQLQIICPSCGKKFPISFVRDLAEKKCMICGSELNYKKKEEKDG